MEGTAELFTGFAERIARESSYDLQVEGRRTKRLERGGRYGVYIHSDKNGYGTD